MTIPPMLKLAAVIIVLLTLTSPAKARWMLVTHDRYPPFNYRSEDGSPSGLDTELVLAVMDFLGQAYEIKFVPWKRVVIMVENNQADLGFQFKYTAERRDKYLLIGPLRTGKTVFAVKRDSDISTYTALADLKPYTIGLNLGYSYGDAFDKADYLKKDDGARTNEQLIKKLMLGRVDIILGDRNTLAWASRRLGVYDHIRIIGTYDEFPRYVAVPKSKAHIAGWFEHGLNAIRENGTYRRIMDKWQ